MTIAAPRPRPGRLGRPQPPGRRARFTGVARLALAALLVGAAPFLTAPGQLIADTKFDLAVAPARFLARALSLWDPQQFGMLQDQAAGYLFPMGPFFVLGKLAGLSPWVVQRLWIGLVGAAAFLGMVRLAERLGIGGPCSRIAAGLAYAASPAVLIMIGSLSAEILPAALAPWVIIPLVGAAEGGPRGRAALRSAAAAGLCGGVNAAAVIGALLPALIYLLTLPRAAPRWRILRWWIPAVAAATLWWSVPLVLLMRYGISILPYTESAAVTTATTGLADVLRGTENWVAYLVVNGQPWWPAGYHVATGTLPTLLTGLTAGLGLAGLVMLAGTLRPTRRFLLAVLLAGVLLIASGHVSGLGNPLAGSVADLINGPASPLRNVRKFDPLVRMPIALGLAQLLTAVRSPRWRQLAAVLAALAVGGVALPAYAGGLAAPGSFRQIPSYWRSAASWLDRHTGRQAVLVVPGAPFGQYLWGSPLDDVLQPLTTVDWAERNLSTISSPGNERLLDAIDQQFAAGDGSAGLSAVLARMGVKYLLVRNDLDRATLDGAWPARLHQALAASPGIRKVAQFGAAPVGSFIPDDAATNFDSPYPPVEVYQVAGAAPVATVQPAAGTLRVYGAPESEITLADEGLLGDRPVLLNGDAPGLRTASSIVTDSLRRRVRNFGVLRGSYSPTLAATDPVRTFEAAADYTDPAWAPYQAVASYRGIRGVTASSSAADVGAIGSQWGTGLLPYAAVDGDVRTMWESGSWTGALGQWIQLTFDHPVTPGVIKVAFVNSFLLGPGVARVEVTTGAGRAGDPVRSTSRPQPLRAPPGPTRWLRITVTRLTSVPSMPVGSQVAISEISVPGVRAARVINAPAATVPGSGPLTAVVLSKAQPQPSGCMRTSLRWVCSPRLTVPTEEQYGFDQAFTAPAAARARLRGSAVLVSAQLAQQFSRLRSSQARVWASSTYTPDLMDQARSAFDGDPSTTWVSSPSDSHPTLTISWPEKRTVRRLTIERPPGASGLLQVLVSGSGGQVRGGVVSPSGALAFAPMRTNSLTMQFAPVQMPLEISEVVIPGVPPLGTPRFPFRLACGLGPRLVFDGTVVPTRVEGSFHDLLAGAPVRFSACRRVAVVPGANQVTEPAYDAFDIQDVAVTSVGGQSLGGPAPAPPALAPPGPAPPAIAGSPAGGRLSVRSWGPDRRVLRVSATSRSYLVVNENFNRGWQATLGARSLPAVRLDGWKQAWVLPPRVDGTVTLTYTPNRVYRLAVGGGLAAMATVFLIALVPARLSRRMRHVWPAAATPGTLASRLARRARRTGAGRGLGATVSARAAALPPDGWRAVLRVVCVGAGLLLAGVWLGGYPGAVILASATGVFLAVGALTSGGERWGALLRPRLIVAGLMTAAACGAIGERLILQGQSGPAVTAVSSTVPQVVCLLVVGRLAAALIGPEL